MRKCLALCKRNTLDILRDPLTLFFGLGFPVVLLLLLSAIQANIPVPLFELDHLTPGIQTFGYSFITLFSATIVAKDRSSSLLTRLYTTPLKSSDFILAYTLPLIPMAFLQTVICYIIAVILGLPFSSRVVVACLFSIPLSLFFIGTGLFLGSLLNDKQVGGICGGLLTNLAAWLSGAWFDLNLVGGAFKKIAYLLPYAHAVDMGRAILQGDYAGIVPHIYWVMGYAVVFMVAAILAFLRQEKQQ